MKISTKYYVLALTAVTVIIYSCGKDFIEKNLKNKTVTLISPGDSLKTDAQTQLFYWDVVEGAIKYNLQIVSPDFGSITQLFVDSNVARTKFNYTLRAGTYQWRVRAYNGSSYTEYATRTIMIDTATSLINQTITLLSPPNDSISKTYAQVLSWKKLTGAVDYRMQIINQSTNRLRRFLCKQAAN